MNALMKNKVWLSLAFVMLASLCVQTVFALDNLFVTGILRSYDSKSEIVRIDVTSEGCKGLREFKVPDDAKGDVDNNLIGKRLTVKIDSATCERGKVYNIVER